MGRLSLWPVARAQVALDQPRQADMVLDEEHPRAPGHLRHVAERAGDGDTWLVYDTDVCPIRKDMEPNNDRPGRLDATGVIEQLTRVQTASQEEIERVKRVYHEIERRDGSA